MKPIKSVGCIAWLLLATVGSAQAQQASTAERIRLMEQEIARIETICDPAPGTQRSEVEKKFGPRSSYE